MEVFVTAVGYTAGRTDTLRPLRLHPISWRRRTLAAVVTPGNAFSPSASRLMQGVRRAGPSHQREHLGRGSRLDQKRSEARC